MKQVLITGAGGFCGQHLQRYLLGQGVELHTMGPRSPQVSSTTQTLDAIHPPVTHHQLPDVTDTGVIAAILTAVQPDYIVHLAGVASATQAATFYQINASYAAALLQAMEQTGFAATCPTLLVGTSAEYGAITPAQVPIHETTAVAPYHHYGISKLAQTHLGIAAARTGRPVIMVRPFNIIGPGMPPHLSVESFAQQIAAIQRGEREPVITVGNLGSSRDFIDVAMVMPIYWQLLQNPAAYGQVINVCSGQGIVMADLLQTLIELSGVAVTVEVDPGRFKALDIPVHYGCTQKLTSVFGNAPAFDLKSTLQGILDQRRGLPQ